MQPVLDAPVPAPQRRRGCLAALLLGPWLMGAAPGAARAAAESAGLYKPWPASRTTPPLRLPSFNGPEVAIAGLRGQVVVLNFWASWCGPCRAEMPSLEALQAREAPRGLRVLAVNHRESDGTVRRFLDETALDLPVLRDRDGEAAKAFGVRIFPTTVVIDRQGRAAFSIVGEADWSGDAARRWLAPLF